MSDSLARIQTAVAGRYLISRELGAGTLTTVYVAEQPRLHRHVALKVLRRELAAALWADRFLAATEAAAALRHPNILPLYEWGEADGYLYYTMPYLQGETLRDWLRRDGHLSLEDALRVARDVAHGLAAAHGRDIVHLDITPENILLDGRHVLVTDLGIARAVHMAGGDQLVRTGLAMGTPCYLSPEQSTPRGTAGARNDVYALGCVLYEMMVGVPPYTGSTARIINLKRASEPIPSVRRDRQSTPDPVDVAIQKALQPVPSDRFSGAGQFLDAMVDLAAKPSTDDLRWKPWAGGDNRKDRGRSSL